MPAPKQRMDVYFQVPDVYKAMQNLEATIKEKLDFTIFELVKLRSSQINGCSFCVDMHSRALEKHGVKPRKIYAVAAWLDSQLFSEQERAALALAEQVTRIGDGVSDELWEQAKGHFSEEELAALIFAIGAINVWNRISIAAHIPPMP